MATILAKRTGSENPIATDDEHHDALASDPTISQFPQGSTFGDSNATNTSTGGASAFGAPSAGFGSSSGGFGSTTPAGFGASSGFGASTSSFGGTTNNMGSTGTSNMNMSVGNQPVLTGAGSNAAQGADVLVANDNTDWINKKWRPVMGWMYMMVCVCDFTIFPILWSVLQALSHGSVTSQWQPLTLQGAGLFHVAMGAVLGIAAYGRTKEKVAGAA
jgi:Holin of 3TMs, for gene-transfer release